MFRKLILAGFAATVGMAVAAALTPSQHLAPLDLCGHQSVNEGSAGNHQEHQHSPLAEPVQGGHQAGKRDSGARNEDPRVGG